LYNQKILKMNEDKLKLIEIFKRHNPRTLMSEEETRIFFHLATTKEIEFNQTIDELDKRSKIYKHFKPLIDGFQMQVFLSRLKHMTSLKITLGAFIMIAQHLDSAGVAVMLAFYIHNKLPANTVVDINVASMELFPFGFFSNEQLNQIWDEQKVKSTDISKYTCVGAHDNLLDYKEMWEV